MAAILQTFSIQINFLEWKSCISIQISLIFEQHHTDFMIAQTWCMTDYDKYNFIHKN